MINDPVELGRSWKQTSIVWPHLQKQKRGMFVENASAFWDLLGSYLIEPFNDPWKQSSFWKMLLLDGFWKFTLPTGTFEWLSVPLPGDFPFGLL